MGKTRISLLFLLAALVWFNPELIQAQSGPCPAVPDVVSIQLGQPFSFNVTANDGTVGCPVRLMFPSDCFELAPNGDLSMPRPDDPNCCGEFELTYFYEPCMGGGGDLCSATVSITVQCPKPDCFLVNLEDYEDDGGAIGGPPSCAYACENSSSTYYVPFLAGNTYIWSVLGGTYVAGSNAAEIIVTWGAAGTGTVSLVITDSNNQTRVINLCVEVVPSPVAAFSASDSTLCLGSPVSFTNLSIGASGYYWDFGDGNNSTIPSPTHTYSSPGTYLVTLYATRQNYDDRGNPLCCCTDSTSLLIVVDSLPGPSIYCVSTLCSNDSTEYWTDASNCSSYVWTVLDALGNPVTFSGQGTPNISVQWGNGPIGTVSLLASGCDSAYCTDPTTVTVPIIPTTTAINGALVVCENATETYTVPKWMSALYTWTVSGGTILSGQGTNTVTVQWGLAPGPGLLSVVWNSTFLGGLPGQEPEDCMGSANIVVAIKPAFSISGPSPSVVCVNSISGFFASPVDNYTWTVSPAASFSGQGSSAINVSWTTPGIYTVTAVPNDTTAYCNDQVSLVVSVIQILPPDSISGPDEICPGETLTYFGYASQPGLGLNWTVTGGSPAFFTGDALTVTWNPSGPYSLSLTQSQLSAPFCVSDPIVKSITAKTIAGPLAITGSGNCTNGLGSYVLSPAQHPDATITWSISPLSSGSVVSGQGSDSITVQWNNTAGLVTVTATVALCGNSVPVMQNFNLIAAIPPVITQSGVLCPGAPAATLDAGPGYTSYSWSTGGTAQTTNITSGGTYNVQVVDANGCPAFDTYNAVALPGPVANISSPGPLEFCTDPPVTGSMTMTALTNPNYTYQWYCNATLQVTPPTQNTLTHTNTGVPGVFVYYVVVTDISTGCVNTSNSITVLQYDDCEANGPQCTAQMHSVSFSAINQTPFCNIVDFPSTTSGPVTLTGWNFSDPYSNVNSGTLSTAQHTYTQAGVYAVTLSYSVAAAPPDTGFCQGSVSQTVTIPLAADFEYRDSCSSIIFTDFSTFVPGNSITSWSWTFGDAGTSSAPDPIHTYALSGTYLVTLTVTDVNGCQAVYSTNVTVPGPPAASISIAPNPACVGDPVSFTSSGTGILNWFWTFGDGSDNGAQNPQHSYLSAGTFPVSLTVTDGQGCQNTVFSSVLINPAVPEDSITYLPSLTICQGETVTLFAPAGPYTYLWSTGATSSSITTGTAGSYGVTITDPNGCSRDIDPVDVVVIPKPVAVISGNPYICDDGCITLQATQGAGLSYQWLDDLGNPLAGQIAASLQVCDTSLLAGYAVIVTNANGCSDTSAVITVVVAASPVFTVQVVGDSCAGSPNVLSVVPVQSGVLYSWSNGGNGPSITVSQPGTYTAFGTDTATGCSSSASATIHPLPDLCIVPAGCYEACNPDTICGPDGLAMYQWNFNGIPIPGETNQCLIVTMSGTYSLTGTTSFGCELTSDDLNLELIPCDGDSTLCDLVDVSAKAGSTAEDSCCWTLSLSNGAPNTFIGVRIEALGGVNLGYSGSAAGWFNIGSTPSSVDLLEPGLGFVPTGSYTGVLSDVAQFCLSGYTATPQLVVVSWLIPGPPPLGYLIECSDTLSFSCKPEGCVEIVYDTIYCDEDSIIYDFYLTNESFSFDILSFRLNVEAGADYGLSQHIFNVPPIPPLATGGPFRVRIGGPGAVVGNALEFTVTAHNAPIIDTIDQTYCCTDTIVIVVPFPDCDPCDDIDVLAQKIEGDCCYQITLVNNFDPNYFTGLQTQLITPGATFGTITGAYPLGWVYAPNAPNDIDWIRVPFGSYIPTGNVPLPVICLGGSYPASVLLVVNWLVAGVEGDSIACSDTLELICKATLPDCAVLLNDSIYCDPMGNYIYQFQVVNNSGVTIDQVSFTNVSPASVSLAPISLTLANGDTSAVISTVISGSGAVPGAVICFSVTLHDQVSGLDYVCCTADSSYCITLPDCIIEPQECDPTQAPADLTSTVLSTQVLLTWSPVPLSVACQVQGQRITPPGPTPVQNLIGFEVSSTTVPIALAGEGTTWRWRVRCACSIDPRIVTPYSDWDTFSIPLVRTAELLPRIELYPNPVVSELQVVLYDFREAEVFLQIQDIEGRILSQNRVVPSAVESRHPLDVSTLPNGIYLLSAHGQEGPSAVRFIKLE